MRTFRWTSWRRDLVIGLSGACLGALTVGLVGLGTIHNLQEQVEEAQERAQHAEQRAESGTGNGAEEPRPRWLDQVTKAYLGSRLGSGKKDVEAFSISTDSVAPEIPKGAVLLIDKSVASYAVGDIVVFRDGGRNFFGRVVTAEPEKDWLAVGRNGEEARRVSKSNIMGRGVMNTR